MQQTFMVTCQECGELILDFVDYTPNSHSFYFCEDCTDKLESRAHFVNELAEIRQRKIAENDSATDGYTWRQVRQPQGRVINNETQD